MDGLLSSSDRFHQKYVHTNICVQRLGASCIFLGLYVDDLIFVSNQKKKLDSITSFYLGNVE
jgi:hypothetical protein